MRLNAIKAFAYRQCTYFLKQGMYLFTDLFLWPLFIVVTYGFLVINFTSDKTVIMYVIAAAICWRIMGVFEEVINLGFVVDHWNDSVKQTWVMPFRLREFLMGCSAQALVGAGATLLVTLTISIIFFKIIYQPIEIFIIAIIGMMIWGIILGMLVLALTLRVGEAAERVMWFATDLVVLTSGVFYPVTILPEPFHTLAYFLPSTYIFQMLREQIVYLPYLVGAALMLFGYLIIARIALKYSLNHAKNIGRLVRFY